MLWWYKETSCVCFIYKVVGFCDVVWDLVLRSLCCCTNSLCSRTFHWFTLTLILIYLVFFFVKKKSVVFALLFTLIYRNFEIGLVGLIKRYELTLFKIMQAKCFTPTICMFKDRFGPLTFTNYAKCSRTSFMTNKALRRHRYLNSKVFKCCLIYNWFFLLINNVEIWKNAWNLD